LDGAGITLSDRAQVSGAIWMIDSGGESRLTVSDQAGIEFDDGAIEAALRFMPVTQIYWRIIVPELSG